MGDFYIVLEKTDGFYYPCSYQSKEEFEQERDGLEGEVKVVGLNKKKAVQICGVHNTQKLEKRSESPELD